MLRKTSGFATLGITTPITEPAAGDLVIHAIDRNGKSVFAIHSFPGPDQVVKPTREGAVAHAIAFAERQNVRVWISNGDARYTLVKDFFYRAALQRLRAEFLEMPGLQVTAAQAQRLCGIDRTMCKALLDALVETKFLSLKRNGRYARASDGRSSG